MTLRAVSLLSVVLVALSCEQSSAYQQAVVARIEAIGGTARLYQASDIKAKRLPQHFVGKVGAVHLDKLDLRGVDLSQIIPSETVSILSMKCSQIDESQVSCLATCQQLKLVDLCSTNVGATTLGFVGEIAGLDTLYADRTLVTDEGLLQLAACKELQEISVRDTLVTQRGVAQFLESRAEVDVLFWSTAPSDKVRQALIALEGNGAEIVASTHAKLAEDKYNGPIRYSITCGTAWQDDTAACDATSLQTIVDSSATSIGLHSRHTRLLDWLGQLRHVNRLWFGQQVSLTDDDIDAITKTMHAHSLHLQAPMMSEKGFAFIARVGTLEHLILDGVPLPREGVKKLVGLKKLKKLSIFHSDCTDGVIKELLGLEPLQELELRSCPNVTAIAVGMLRKQGIKVTTDARD